MLERAGCRALLAGIVLVVAPVRADDAWRVHLSAPLSPGSVAVLVEHGDAPEVQARWREALRHEAPEVRAAAARMVHVGGARGLVEDLQAAFVVETDAPTGAEQIRMLVASKTEIPDAELLAAARRMPALVRIAARVAGRRRGLDALAQLSAWREVDPTGDGRRALITAATDGGQEAMGRAASAALRDEDPEAWETVLALARGREPLDDALVIASMQARNARVRAATYWYLAGRAELEASLWEAVDASPEALASFAAGAQASAEEADAVDARFGFELLRRVRGFSPRENAAWLAKIEGQPDPPSLPGPVASIEEHLTAPERQLLFKKKALLVGEVPAGRSGGPLDDPPAIRSNVGYFPRGFASSVLAAAGCEAKAEARVLVEVVGSTPPRRAAVIWKEASDACAEAARVLAATSFSAMPPATHGRDLRLLALSPAFVAWLDEAGPLAFAGRGSRFPPPRKVHDTRVPKPTKNERQAGPAVVEALIGPTGDVWSLHFLGGAPGYALSALPPAGAWRYAPTEVDGSPHAVLATLEIGW